MLVALYVDNYDDIGLLFILTQEIVNRNSEKQLC